MLEGVGSTIIARDLAYELSGTTDHFVEVLNSTRTCWARRSSSTRSLNTRRERETDYELTF